MNRNSSNLTLNSYKVDTTSLHNSIKQLSSIKQQLQTTISQYRLNENVFIEENQRLKEQINMLHLKLKNRPVDQDKWNQKIHSLEESLKKEKEQKIKYKEMYQVQRKNHEELRQFYEKKLQNWQGDHHLLVNKYQQRINSLRSEITQIKVSPSQIAKERKSFNSKKDSHADNPYSSASNLDSVQGSHKKIPSKPLMDAPQCSLSKQECQTPHWKIEEEPDEEIFQQSIRKLYFSIKQMGITSRQSMMLPQMRKMKANKAPSRKDILNFMKNPPMEEKDRTKIEKNINLLDSVIHQKYGKVTGENIINFIIEKVQEYEMAEKLNSDDISVSGITPSLNKASSYGLSSLSHLKSDQKNLVSKKSGYRASITDALKLESEGSFIK